MNDNKHTVLLVDDEEKILHSLKRLLRKEGYRLFTASSGDEGLKILEENDIHLVISDPIFALKYKNSIPIQSGLF